MRYLRYSRHFRTFHGPRGLLLLGSALLGSTALACGGDDPADRAQVQTRARSVGGERPSEDGGRCDTDAPGREVSEYDTSGDEFPDVRKVFLTLGEGRLARLVLICREADLNGDGTKDVVRYYNDEGRPLREESDRNFDGQMDSITYFERGRIIRQELDSTGNGIVDTKIFYEDGRPLRAERDVAGRSTAQTWQPDRWEYYEEGRLIRVGTDVDGVGGVDRWDRDIDYQHELEARRAREEAEAEAEEAEEAGDEESAEDS